MKIAITAASGQLGKEIVKATVALLSKENVIGLARTPDKAKDLGIKIRPGDYNDKDILEKSLQSVDTLLLVSGMDAPEKRIEQHRNVIRAAQNSGVKKIVYTSVQGQKKILPFLRSSRATGKLNRIFAAAVWIGLSGAMAFISNLILNILKPIKNLVEFLIAPVTVSAAIPHVQS